MTNKLLVNISEKKKKGEKIAMLTAYDFLSARLVDESGTDMILVGDSLANVILGYESTVQVSMEEMLHHTRAVVRGAPNALIVGDMPYAAYQPESSDPIGCAKQFMEAGCCAVKLEWYHQCFDVTKAIIDQGIPVMGHIGLTPQTAESYTVQGKDDQSAKEIIDQAKALDAAGCFAIVLECVPVDLAKTITQSINAVTIGIGAGPHCDGQVLVTHDILGLFDKFKPKFVKRYAQLKDTALEALKTYNKEVRENSFPDEQHSY